MFNLISFTPARQNADLMGAFVAGWADAGLHPETFWLGYATGPATAWHPASASPAELMNSFYDLLDRKSTRLNSSHGYISYAVFCLKKKKKHKSLSTHSSILAMPTFIKPPTK